MMYKRLTALVLLLMLLATCVPAHAEAARFAVLHGGAGEGAAEVLRDFMLYSSWQCDHLDAWASPDLSGYDAIILCIGENQELPQDTAAALADTEVPLFVVGSGGLTQAAPEAALYAGDVVIRCETERGEASDRLLSSGSLWMLPEAEDVGVDGTVYVDGKPYPLCGKLGRVTHFAFFDAEDPLLGAKLADALQLWQWPYQNEPTAYGQYLVMEYMYPFLDPADLMARTEMLREEGVPYALAVTPIFSNGEYPAMKRFCEFLRYEQSLGTGIIIRVPFVSIGQVSVEELMRHMRIAYDAYASYGVYPLAIQAPVAWLQCEKGLEALRGFRTVFLFSSDDEVVSPLPQNAAYRDGHQIVAPAWEDYRAFSSSYAQAIYLHAEMDIGEMRDLVQRLKNSNRAFKSLREMQNVVYSGDFAVQAEGGAVTVNGVRQNLAYTPFTYEAHFTFDRGITQYLKEQIETSNQWLVTFVIISCTVFIVMMVLFRRQAKRDLVMGRKVRKQKPKEEN